MADNITMAREGTSFSWAGGGLSWPTGGIREVIELPFDKRGPVRQRMANGYIIETNLPVTAVAEASGLGEYRLLTGAEARAHKAIPAGAVIPPAEYFRYGKEAVDYLDERDALLEAQRQHAADEIESARIAEEADARVAAGLHPVTMEPVNPPDADEDAPGDPDADGDGDDPDADADGADETAPEADVVAPKRRGRAPKNS